MVLFVFERYQQDYLPPSKSFVNCFDTEMQKCCLVCYNSMVDSYALNQS